MRKIVAIIMLAVLLFPAFGGGSQEASEKNNLVRIAMDPPKKGEVDIDGYNTTESNSVIILQNLYEGLFSYSPESGKPEKAIADSWEVSEDKLTWTFHLKKNAIFSDGSQITAGDFVKSWNKLLENRLAYALDFVSRDKNNNIEVNASDDNTLTIKVTASMSDLPSRLCQPCLAVIKSGSVYSGPYVLKYLDSKKINLRPNKYYWGEIKNSGVDITLSTDSSDSFLSGDTDWALSYVKNGDKYKITNPLYGTSFFYFSAKDGPFASEEIKQALYGVIPWETIKLISSVGYHTSSLVPESEAVTPITGDSTELYRSYGKSLPNLKMGVHRGAQTATAAEMIADIWSKTFGMTVTLDTVPLTVYSADPENNPYDFVCITWIGDYYSPFAFLSLFESSSSYNLANYHDELFDDLMVKACNNPDYLLKAEQRLLDTCTVIPISQAVSTNYVHSEYLGGWYPNMMDIHPFKYLSLSD